MVQFFLSIFILFMSSSGAFAKDSCGVSLTPPADWLVKYSDKVKPPGCFEAIHPKKLASVIAMKANQQTKTCPEFMKEIENSRSLKNLLPVSQQKMPPEQVQSALMESGSLGEYDVTNRKMKTAVNQQSFCFKKNQDIWVLTFTYQKEKGPEMEPFLKSILKDFKFSGAKPSVN